MVVGSDRLIPNQLDNFGVNQPGQVQNKQYSDIYENKCTDWVYCMCVVEKIEAIFLPLEELQKTAQKNIRLLDHWNFEKDPLKTPTKL